jgi:hypothetical protein
VLAAGLTQSGTISSIFASQEVTDFVDFEAGYEEGAHWAKPNVKIITTYYSGSLETAFTDPTWGIKAVRQQLQDGSDVVVGAGGSTAQGALEEVALRTTKTKPLYCIGFFADYWASIPEERSCLVSSGISLVGPSLSNLILQVMRGTVGGDEYVGDVGLASFHTLASAVPLTVQKQITQAEADLKTGKIQTKKGRTSAKTTPLTDPVAKPGHWVGTTPPISFDITSAGKIRNFKIGIPFPGIQTCNLKGSDIAIQPDGTFAFTNDVQDAQGSTDKQTIGGTFYSFTHLTGFTVLAVCDKVRIKDLQNITTSWSADWKN